MTLRLPPVQPRSRKALEAAEFARDQGCFDEMHNALFRAFFEDGRDLNDTGVLLDVGASVGLDRGAVAHCSGRGRHTDTVLADERLASELGCRRCRPCWLGAQVNRSKQPSQSVVHSHAVRSAAVERALHGDIRGQTPGPVSRARLPICNGQPVRP